MSLTIPEIRELFASHGGRTYGGEHVSQLEHALQTAQFAEKAGADASLVTAALLHDLGHLLNDQGETPTGRGIDDVHQFFALPFLRGLFSDSVLQPIKLHVDAKRYLCATRAGYREALSADSQRSLALQGGVYDRAQCAAFEVLPGAEQAVSLRVWDDAAKIPGHPTPAFEHYVTVMEAMASRRR